MLESYIREKRKLKDILLMTHIVIGYPSLEASFQMVRTMVSAGVDLMELQIPFSEPIADGPVILEANQEALSRGVTVADCMAFAEQAASAFDIPFLIMSYYNILYKFGVEGFTQDLAGKKVCGIIVPDLPHEEGQDYLEAMQTHGMDPIFIFSPTTTAERMAQIARHARGFMYCVARKGVTGHQTAFSKDLELYLDRCRRATNLPLALGFGVQDKTDVDFLAGKADIAVIGSQTIRIMDEYGIEAIGPFIGSLRK